MENENLLEIPPTYIKCADQGNRCISAGVVYYGKNGKYVKKNKHGLVNCTNSEFIDERNAVLRKPENKNFVDETDNQCYTGEKITKCADEGGICNSVGKVYYGASDQFIKKYEYGPVSCSSKDFLTRGGLNMLAQDNKLYLFPNENTTSSFNDPIPNVTKACYTSTIDDTMFNINDNTYKDMVNLSKSYDETLAQLENTKNQLLIKINLMDINDNNYKTLQNNYNNILAQNAILTNETLKNVENQLKDAKDSCNNEKEILDKQIKNLIAEKAQEKLDYENKLIQKENEKVQIINNHQKDLDNLKNYNKQLQDKLVADLETNKQNTIDKITALFKQREDEYLSNLRSLETSVNNLAVTEKARQDELIKQLEDQRNETKKQLKNLYDERESYYASVIDKINNENNKTFENLKNQNQQAIDKLNSEYKIKIANIDLEKNTLNTQFEAFKKFTDDNIEQIRSAFNELEAMYIKRIANLEKEVEDKNKQMIEDITTLNNTFKTQIDEMLDATAATKQQIKNETNIQIDTLLNNYKNSKVSIDRDFENEKLKRSQDFKNMLDSQKNEYDKRINELQTKNNNIINDLEELNNKYKNTLESNQLNLETKIKENKENINYIMQDYESKKTEMENNFFNTLDALEKNKIDIVKKKQAETLADITNLSDQVESVRKNFENKKTTYDNNLKNLIITLENDKIKLIKDHNNTINTGIDELNNKYDEEKIKILQSINNMRLNLSNLNIDYLKIKTEYDNINQNYDKRKTELDNEEKSISRLRILNIILFIITLGIFLLSVYVLYSYLANKKL
jgi:hypothetical protein